MKEAEILYPCDWSFTIIGSDKELIKANVTELLHESAYSFGESKKSKTGKYTSYILSTRVASKQERNELFYKLKNIPTVQMVL